MSLPRNVLRLARLAVVLSVLHGCGGSDGGGLSGPDPDVAPFVGEWEATRFFVESADNPDVGFDVVELGGSFTLIVQPSGQYTAILEFPDLPGPPPVEVGQIDVNTDQGLLTLRPTGGPPATSSFAFDGPDMLRLEGPTEFDFNTDGLPEPASSSIVLQRN